MIVEGLFNPSHIVRTFVSHEYAFEIKYKDHAIRIAHTKGTWSCCKLKDGTVIDYVEINDCRSGVDSDNGMLEALVESIQEQLAAKNATTNERDWDGKMIEKVLSIWGGKPSSIERISVVQPGRNAWVDNTTGNFFFAPREGEFYT